MSNVCSQPGNNHQTNDVIAQSGKCHVMSMLRKRKRENMPPSYGQRTSFRLTPAGMNGARVQRQLAWRAWMAFVNMHVMWLWC